MARTRTPEPEVVEVDSEQEFSDELPEAEAQEDTTQEQEQEKAPEPEVDFTQFNQSLADAVSQSDDTGLVPDGAIASVRAAYQALPGIKAKNEARELVKQGMTQGILNDSMPQVRSYDQISREALVAASKSSASEKAPADPTESFVLRYSALHLATQLVGETVPDEVSSNWADRSTELVNQSQADLEAVRNWDGEGDMPDVSQVVRQAYRIATRKGTGSSGRAATGTPYTGARRNVAAHIASAFADQPSGTVLTVDEIRKHRSEEYGPNDAPSAGAISARIDAKKFSLEGVEPDRKNDNKALRKL